MRFGSGILCLKIDVDTHDGMKNGVPALLEDLHRLGLKATFCLSFGPDNAGRAIFRLFTDIGFLKKMLSTGAPRLYGLRTILSGTLLPARSIATAFPSLCKQIEAEGHEVIIHAWDHRRWQDKVGNMNREQISGEFRKAFSAFEDIYGRSPRAVAAPGWQVTKLSLEVQDELELLYASDLRQGLPCFLEANGHHFSTLQIPTTGPCLEELLATGVRSKDGLEEALLGGLEDGRPAVLALHAEVEGGIFRGFFRKFAKRLIRRFAYILPLEEVANTLLQDKQAIPVCNLGFISIPGRAGKVASAICNSDEDSRH